MATDGNERFESALSSNDEKKHSQKNCMYHVFGGKGACPECGKLDTAAVLDIQPINATEATVAGSGKVAPSGVQPVNAAPVAPVSATPRPYERAEALAWAEARGDTRTVAVIRDLERELAEANQEELRLRADLTRAHQNHSADISSAPSSSGEPVGWVATKDDGATLHFSKAQGWSVEVVLTKPASATQERKRIATERVGHCGTFDHEGRCGACAEKLSELKQGLASCPLSLYPPSTTGGKA